MAPEEKKKQNKPTNNCRDFETFKNWQQKLGVHVDLI